MADFICSSSLLGFKFPFNTKPTGVGGNSF